MDRILLDSILQNILNVRSVYTDNLKGIETYTLLAICLLYTSDAADEL